MKWAIESAIRHSITGLSSISHCSRCVNPNIRLELKTILTKYLQFPLEHEQMPSDSFKPITNCGECDSALNRVGDVLKLFTILQTFELSLVILMI